MAQCRLTERMILQKYDTLEGDEEGFSNSHWDEDYYSCWCSFRSVSGKEYFSAKTDNSENIVTFTVRYCNKTKPLVEPGATKEFRILYKKNLYNIKYACDIQDKHQWITIKAEVIS